MRGDKPPFQNWRVVGIVTMGRLYLFGILYIFFLNTDLNKDKDIFLFQEEGQSREIREAQIQESFWARLGPFDGQFYLDIANKGYRTISSSINGDLGNYAFFPLIPSILIIYRAVLPHFYIPLMIGTTFVAGVLGTLILKKLAEKCDVSPFLAVIVLLCFPSAPFQFILYSEGIFLCLSGMALLSALAKKPMQTFCFGLVAGLCRPQGILLAIPAFIELLLPHLRDQRPVRKNQVTAWLATCAPFVGFLVMCIVSKVVSGSPTAFLSVQSKWGRTYEAGGIFKALLSVFSYYGPPMDLLGLLLGLGLIPLMWKRLRPSVFFYGVGAVAMPLLTGSILSLGRFMSVSVPHILAIALFLQLCSKETKIAILMIFLVFQTLLARGLIGWYFVG
jgi:hypothetical protein